MSGTHSLVSVPMRRDGKDIPWLAGLSAERETRLEPATFGFEGKVEQVTVGKGATRNLATVRDLGVRHSRRCLPFREPVLQGCCKGALLAASGVNLATIQSVMGHSALATTGH